MPMVRSSAEAMERLLARAATRKVVVFFMILSDWVCFDFGGRFPLLEETEWRGGGLQFFLMSGLFFEDGVGATLDADFEAGLAGFEFLELGLVEVGGDGAV